MAVAQSSSDLSFGGSVAGATRPAPTFETRSKLGEDTACHSSGEVLGSALFMEKVVIIGSGCAGLTAALYTARANLRPLVLTGRQPGGLLTTTTVVENFPGFPEGIDGYELMARMQKQAERFGAQVRFGVLEAADLSRQPFELTVDGEKIQTETMIIASGASHKHLGLESEHKLENK